MDTPTPIEYQLDLSPYSIIPQPRTKPVRYMVMVDDTVIAKGLKRQAAVELVAMKALTCRFRKEFNLAVEQVKQAGI